MQFDPAYRNQYMGNQYPNQMYNGYQNADAMNGYALNQPGPGMSSYSDLTCLPPDLPALPHFHSTVASRLEISTADLRQQSMAMLLAVLLDTCLLLTAFQR